MSLKVKDIIKIMNQYAPIKLKEDYDNVGLMIGDKEKQVTKILVALDTTLDVIEEAKEKQCNFILNHHPILFLKPKSITTDTLLGKKIINLIKNDINVYASHTNLDSVENGINEMATRILGYDKFKVLDCSRALGYNNGKHGIGRLVKLEQGISLKELCIKVKKSFKASNIRYTGNEEKLIKTIAIINGSGQDYLNLSKTKGADCIITGDTTYHYISDIKEEGIAVIDAGHFVTEWLPMVAFSKKFEEILRNNGFNNEIILSEKTVDPYKYV
ncbi:Nif3-like dinuclear metal center hexameric protein [Clostridium sp. ATCC 25772]|uniref:Nif3-like dinuclear metal center hexameric protein n=1 Tax=Clostridium sp. ATCC 25772 TaxID=1676991 RepID=UPI000781F1AA|nr:Nif3-like dinuclear metal center hexameric protein [Clostridium sp. ATCC 25772]